MKSKLLNHAKVGGAITVRVGLKNNQWKSIMAKGGRRKNAGRKKGSPNRATAEIRKIIDSEVDFSNVVRKLSEVVNGIEVQ